MLILKMNDKKQLFITKYGNTFEGENNAESITVIVPKMLNEIEMVKCACYFNVLSTNSLDQLLYQKTINISPILKDYNNFYLSCEIDISKELTQKAGQVKFWIKVTNADNEMIAKTKKTVSWRVKK